MPALILTIWGIVLTAATAMIGAFVMQPQAATEYKAMTQVERAVEVALQGTHRALDTPPSTLPASWTDLTDRVGLQRPILPEDVAMELTRETESDEPKLYQCFAFKDGVPDWIVHLRERMPVGTYDDTLHCAGMPSGWPGVSLLLAHGDQSWGLRTVQGQ